MQPDSLAAWRHEHAFGQDAKRPGERRTQIVIAITATMMIVEIVAGMLFGSMALLADGLHMASHAAALTINAFAYVYARRHARDANYSFGTGKINTLGGFTGAVLLAGFALVMAIESVQRLVVPLPIAFDQAIFVAVVGLIVNGVSMWILGHEHDHGHGHTEHHDHDHDHDHDHRSHEGGAHDHNLVSAYLHVLADALTSILAIAALLAAKYFGSTWMDPLMGIVGAVLVARWSFGLLRDTSAVLLDRSAPQTARDEIRASLEAADGARVVDLHVWCIGLNLYSVVAVVVSPVPRTPEHYKALLPPDLGIVHATIEVNATGPAR
ncbi:MAG: CDF family Co(II)/Ni(II) efflux transporter DmeF [Gammaproteobacteria bacterium]